MEFRLECLYDVDWQKLRVSLLAANNDYGGFGTIIGVKTNLGKLFTYSRSQHFEDEALRFWRVSNLLSATLMGYGKKPQFTDHYELIEAAQREYSELLASRGATFHRFELNKWSWRKVSNELYWLYMTDRDSFDMIWKNMIIRVQHAKRKEAAGTTIRRAELSEFMRRMREIMAANDNR